MNKESMIKVLRYKAEHIKTKIKPEFFDEVADVLERLQEKENENTDLRSVKWEIEYIVVMLCALSYLCGYIVGGSANL